MKSLRSLFTIAALILASSAWAYQVTGPVLEVSDSKIVVQKGKEKWEIARTPDTKVCPRRPFIDRRAPRRARP